MMKVLWFANTPCNADDYFNSELKGTGGWLKALDQSLQDKMELHIAFHYDYLGMSNFIYKKTNYYPIRIYKSKIQKYWSILTSKIYDKEFKEKYLQIIKQVKPDIIHIHGTENPYSCIIGETDIPIVVSIQGNLTVYSHKYCSGFSEKYLSVSRSKKIIFRKSFKSGYISQLRRAIIEQRNLLYCKYIFGRTDWDRRITSVLAPDSKYYHEDRVLRDAFYDAQWQPHKREKLVLYTTNGNNFYKGFETICRALFELNKIGINCEWRVAGIEKDDLIVKVTKKFLKNKYPLKGLILEGRVNSNDLVKNLLNSDIYVMASHIENNVNSLCEAMILGMPCISTFVGGTGSLIKDGVEGILIQDGDPWAMAGAILELANNKEKAVEMGKRAREIALQRHDKNRIINDIMEHYNNIIEDHKNEKV